MLKLSEATHRGEPLEWHMSELMQRLRWIVSSGSAAGTDIVAATIDRIEFIEAVLDAKVARVDVLEAALREIAANESQYPWPSERAKLALKEKL